MRHGVSYRRAGDMWVWSFYGPTVEASGHFVMLGDEAREFAEAVRMANLPRDPDVVDVMEAG
jgi:hypothetical protein